MREHSLTGFLSTLIWGQSGRKLSRNRYVGYGSLFLKIVFQFDLFLSAMLKVWISKGFVQKFPFSPLDPS